MQARKKPLVQADCRPANKHAETPVVYNAAHASSRLELYPANQMMCAVFKLQAQLQKSFTKRFVLDVCARYVMCSPLVHCQK